MNTYKVKYKIEPGEFTKAQLEAEGAGGCDEFGLISVLGGVLNGQQMSVAMVSMKADGGQWDGDQWFEIWSMMAHNILQDKTISPERRHILQDAFNKVRAMKGVL